METRYVELEYSFEFKSERDAQLGAARLDTDGIKTEVGQGRFDGELSDTIWWVSFVETRWVANADALFDGIVSEVEARAKTIEGRLAELGCLQSLWGVSLSDGPGDEA